MLGTGPRGQVVSAFSDQLQREVSAKAVDRGNVLSEQREQRGANVESQGVCLIGSLSTPWRWNCPVITTTMDAQFLQYGFDPHVACRGLLVVGRVEGERLFERKQMLGPVVAGERLRDRLRTGVTTGMAQASPAPAGRARRQGSRERTLAGRAGDVGDDVVKLNVHLGQRLLHMWMCEAAYSSRRSR